MSQVSRSTRRQSGRGAHHTPPPRDPMKGVYMGFFIVLVLILGGLGIYKWRENARIAAAYATPTPGPVGATPSPKPIDLATITKLGSAKFPKGDTIHGGQGQIVDGISCAAQEYVTLHVHQHLDLYVNGKQMQIPQFIGTAPGPSGGCLYWVHTHDESGTIHVEAPVLAPTGASGFTLGMFFDIWGEPLTSTQVATFKGPVVAFVNGQRFEGDLQSIPLKAHTLIELNVGLPIVSPKTYTFPPGV